MKRNGPVHKGCVLLNRTGRYVLPKCCGEFEGSVEGVIHEISKHWALYVHQYFDPYKGQKKLY